MKLFLSFVVLLVGAAALKDDTTYRLQNVGISDIEYTLDISRINETFNGQVVIQFKLAEATKTIQLHADGIIPQTTVFDTNTAVTVSGPDANQILTLTTEEDLAAGVHKLTILYTGNVVQDEMYGFYKSTYGDDQVLFATQFEPTYARRLLPCFDEPAYKATFQVKVKHDDEYTALSNTPVQSKSKNRDATTTTAFEKTPVMSTYLLAVVVSKFVNNGPVWTSEAQSKYTTTAADATPKLVEQLGNFVGIAYTSLGISKSDQVAIPDFAAGAMENWGLITYRESDLLDEADKTTASGKQKVATVICHELAHQWFGDYVTLDWWGETWLNEGFATYFEYHVANLLQDDFELDKQFVVKVVQTVLQSDSVSSVQALYTPDADVASLVQINNKFTDISYDKGGSVLRMVQHVLGLDEFKKVLKEYLTAHKNSNVKHDDLIKSIGTNGEKFRKWFEQPGYPLVTVSLDGTTLKLSQKHYTTKDTKQTWSVPITYISSAKDTSSDVAWLDEAAQELVLADKADWVVLNYQQGGYYRVNYDAALWTAITKALTSNLTQIDELNRAQLIDDAFNLANTADLSYNTAFDLIKYLDKETSYYPWYSTFSAITSLLKKVEDTDIATNIKKELLSLMSSVISIPKSSTEEIDATHIEKLRTVDVLAKACAFGHENCIKFSKTVLSDYLKDKNINNDYRAFGLCNALANSDSTKDWDSLWALVLKAETSHEKDDMLIALTCSQNEDILSKYLDKTIDATSGIRRQDGKTVIKNIVKSGPSGIKVGLKFMANKGKELMEYYKGMNALGDLVSALAQAVTDEEDVKTLQAFIEANQGVEEVKQVGEQCKEVMAANLQWWVNNKDLLSKRFPKVSGAASTVASITMTVFGLGVLFLFKM